MLTFPAGSPTGSSICVDISIINDNELELFGENFFANIDSADATTAPDRAQINLGESNDESTYWMYSILQNRLALEAEYNIIIMC